EVAPLSSPLTQEEVQCETHYSNTHWRDSDGRYVVRLPFKDSVPQLGNSLNAAQKRLIQLEVSLKRNHKKQALYTEFLEEYLELDHMEAITIDSIQKCPSRDQYFLPHHGILKESSSTTKLRVVFDASANTS